MDIKELDKRQLILLTLLITFVVSIGTGIVTVSLMKQMPKSIPQTINNVIQRTIEKVSTVEVPATTKTTDTNVVTPKDTSALLIGNSDALVNIYSNNVNSTTTTSTTDNVVASGTTNPSESVSLGQGVIVSDIGLILVDSSILTDLGPYKVVLNKINFNASVLKSFGNGFTILKISPITDKTKAVEGTNNVNKTQ